MVFCYGASQDNVAGAARLYAERFPDRRHPARQCFGRIIQRFRETGRVDYMPRPGRPNTATGDNTTVVVLASVAATPHTSTRAIAQNTGISQRSVCRILHRHRFHPFHVHCHQALDDHDFQRRMDYCNWLLNKQDEDPTFVFKILWCDESQFTRDGVVNKHNMHYWAQENPRWLRQTAHQVNWRVNVWCGIYNRSVIGPFFYDGTLTGPRY
jgi:hypothetical protein